MLRSGQPHTDVTTPPGIADSGTVVIGAVVRTLHGTAYSDAAADTELGDVVRVGLGTEVSGMVVEGLEYCWQSRVRHR